MNNDRLPGPGTDAVVIVEEIYGVEPTSHWDKDS